MEDFQESDALDACRRRRTGDRALRDVALRRVAHVGAAAWDARCGRLLDQTLAEEKKIRSASDAAGGSQRKPEGC